MAFVPANVAQFLFDIAGFDQEFRVVTFTGEEGISHVFRFTLDLAAATIRRSTFRPRSASPGA